MRRSSFLASLVMFLISMPSLSWAHFIWIASGPQVKDGKVHIYFSEDASPDDPKFLEKISAAKLNQVLGDGNAVVLKTAQDSDSLAADVTSVDGSVFCLSHEYGVITRGPEPMLLKYYAKSQPSANPQTWRAVGKEKMLLELVARSNGAETIFTVLWQGAPLANTPVTVTGPGISSKLEVNSNDKGEASFPLKNAGLYSVRTKNSETTPGETEGKKYAVVRHYTTLTLNIAGSPSAETAAITTVSTLPPLEPGITSFGAAIVGDALYTYGGHFGKPHHYSESGQSNNLLKLALGGSGKWEVVSTGPKRTGLAAVGYGGKFYRIGGFEARNTDDQKQSLWSMPDFASFDPKTGEWRDLPPLPQGRSSHDALVIGSTLYVVGGWELKGEDEKNWHDTAYSVDLAATPLEWKALPKQPFQRRALSLGEWQGKVYVIGGMQTEGGPTTATAFFDPKTGEWGEGPKLNGEAMEGFGSSAFRCASKLCVTTFAGNLQVLSDDGTKWVNQGKLAHPRFFHRMLPLNDTEVVIVGGASMQSGKIRELETIAVPQSSSD